LILYLFSQKQT